MEGYTGILWFELVWYWAHKLVGSDNIHWDHRMVWPCLRGFPWWFHVFTVFTFGSHTGDRYRSKQNCEKYSWNSMPTVTRTSSFKKSLGLIRWALLSIVELSYAVIMLHFCDVLCIVTQSYTCCCSISGDGYLSFQEIKQGSQTSSNQKMVVFVRLCEYIFCMKLGYQEPAYALV